MQSNSFALGREYPAYEYFDKLCSEPYVKMEILDSLKPGEYA